MTDLPTPDPRAPDKGDPVAPATAGAPSEDPRDAPETVEAVPGVPLTQRRLDPEELEALLAQVRRPRPQTVVPRRLLLIAIAILVLLGLIVTVSFLAIRAESNGTSTTPGVPTAFVAPTAAPSMSAGRVVVSVDRSIVRTGPLVATPTR